MIIEVLTQAQCAQQWGAIGAHLKRACEYDVEQKVTLYSLYDELMEGRSMCVTFRTDDQERGLEGACVITATEIGLGKYLFIKVLGGKFNDSSWVKVVHDHLEQVASVLGCLDGIMFIGRPQWVRKLRALNYREVMVTMIKKLER